MPDPTKTPIEVIYGGIAALLSVVTYWFGRRKAHYENLSYEPVPKIDFEEYKNKMESKFREMDQKQVASSSAILESIQGVREDFAAMQAVKIESDKRLDRMETDSSARWKHIEERLDRALDRHK